MDRRRHGCTGTRCTIASIPAGSSVTLQALREFRDQHLQQFALGRAFIGFYYRHSPPIADLVAAHDSLRLLVRAILTPVVLVVVHPVASLAAVMPVFAAMAGVRAQRRRRP